MFKTRIDLTGERFGRWTVIKYADTRYGNKAYWQCVCDCGTVRCISAANLRSGATKSCGCLNNERIGNLRRTHGMSGTRLYEIWLNMIRRCENPKATRYAYYGGRGIKVFSGWHRFENFLAWSSESGYSDSLTIERVDVNGNYCPENCTWIPLSEQSKNRRNCKQFEGRC